MAKAFVSRVLQVNRATVENAFDIMLEVTVLGATDTSVNLTFSALWGSDWRLAARQAISVWASTNYPEALDGVVFPDLTTA